MLSFSEYGSVKYMMQGNIDLLRIGNMHVFCEFVFVRKDGEIVNPASCVADQLRPIIARAVVRLADDEATKNINKIARMLPKLFGKDGFNRPPNNEYPAFAEVDATPKLVDFLQRNA